MRTVRRSGHEWLVIEVRAAAASCDARPRLFLVSHASRCTDQQTVKSINYFGPRSEYVVSGSDCGHIFFWRASDGKLVNILEGDTIGAVNCLECCHDMGLLATSGLENDAKLFWPDREERQQIYDVNGQLQRQYARIASRSTASLTTLRFCGGFESLALL